MAQASPPSHFILVGFGHRTRKTALPALAELRGVVVVAIVDPLIKQILATNESVSKHPLVSGCLKAERLDDIDTEKLVLAECHAYVAVPHFAYESTISWLLRAGVRKVIQEKPLAVTVDAAESLATLSAGEDRLVVAAQRRTSARYNALRDWIPLLGHPRSVHVVDTLHEPNLDSGWRASKALSGGGVVADLGYHMLDTLVGLFGNSGPVKVLHAELLRCRPDEDYDVEDTAHVLLKFGSVRVQIYLSRASSIRQELIEVIGDLGVIRLTQSGVELTPNQGHAAAPPRLVLTTEPENGKTLLSRVFRSIIYPVPARDFIWDINRDVNVVRLVAAIISCSAEVCKIDPAPGSLPSQRVQAPEGHAADSPGPDSGSVIPSYPAKFKWPIITHEIEAAVISQLHEAISIYDNGGIFAAFETEFKAHLGLKADGAYALLHNSGTNALHALYYGLGITKGDIVAVPVYTFHATVSPLMQLGASPLFVDADPATGNMSPIALKLALNSCKVKAVVVTHMWGQPCDMEAIVGLCAAAKVILAEDCSHAHGATVCGKAVGTFGDGAAWSLQGEKVVSGGEGGISVTTRADVHYRSLIHGHYNKRCVLEIPNGHPLRDFALTGAGLKNRAHPLAIAIALNQLQLLPQIHASKTNAATRLIESVCAGVPFLKAPRMAQFAEASWYVIVFNFDASRAPPNVTREVYVAKLVAHGLVDADMPKSTRPLYAEQLYLRPFDVLPGLYTRKDYKPNWTRHDFPGADKFHQTAIKLPVFHNDDASMERYAALMVEAAQELMLDN